VIALCRVGGHPKAEASYEAQLARLNQELKELQALEKAATLLACRQLPFRMLARMLRRQVSWSGRLLKEHEQTFGSSPSDDHENASSYGTHHQRTGIVINWLAA
jgi:hypothetical protein